MRVLIAVLAPLMLAGAVAQDRGKIVARDAIQPQVAVDKEGGIYVAFIQGGNIKVSVSTDKGETFSTPVVAIDAKGNARGGRQRGPRIAVDGKKNIYVTAPVCFDPQELKQRYPKAELWLAVSTDGGNSFSKPKQVNQVSKKAAEALHWLDVSDTGDVHVAWIDGRAGTPAVFYRKLGQRGKKPERDRRVSAPVCPCCAPSITVDGKGNPTVTFREGGQKRSREIYAARSSNKGRSFEGNRQVNRMPTLMPG